MVIQFLLFNIDNETERNNLNINPISIIFNPNYNDHKRQQREVFVKELILKEYLFNRNIEKDKKLIFNNKNIQMFINDINIEKSNSQNIFNFQGLIPITNIDLYEYDVNIIWKYYEGFCISLTLDPNENYLVANSFIYLLINKISPYLNNNFSQILTNLIYDLIPDGQLLILSEKMLEDLIKKNLLIN